MSIYVTGVPKEIRREVWLLFLNQCHIGAIKPVLPPSYHTKYDDMIKGLTSQQHAILIDLGEFQHNYSFYPCVTLYKHTYYINILYFSKLSMEIHR